MKKLITIILLFASVMAGAQEITVKAGDLSEDLTLDAFPRSNKFGDKYQFNCRVTEFSGIKFCKGFENYRARWFEIDGTNVVLKKYEKDTSTAETVAHGLTISRILNINVNVTEDGVAVFNMQTIGGSFTYAFKGWGFDANGLLQVKNDGSVLTDCHLTAANPYFKCPVWIFGASYEGVSKSRYPGHLKEMGYFNFLLNAYAGRNGVKTIEDLQRALAFGCPKYLYYSGSNDSTDEIYQANLDTVLDICKQHGIELLVYYKPDTPAHDYSVRRAAVVAAGCRIVDGRRAVEDPLKTWSEGADTWYDGFLGTDKVHPTSLGAKALAMQFLIDFPEIMEFSK